jgi:GrpB-like predicted nucleotidyltransferase (UPF0157 family)
MTANQMKEHLNDMTSCELGELFPIIIADPNPNWPAIFENEKMKIIASLSDLEILSIEHIGSTAIPFLKAKPTIDILIEVPQEFDKEDFIKKITALDYFFTPKPENPAPHMMFMKGYSSGGFVGQAFHVHVRYKGDWDEIYFRDYLRVHPKVAKEYEDLKVKLSVQYKNDREEYTNRKSDFINRVIQIARKS